MEKKWFKTWWLWAIVALISIAAFLLSILFSNNSNVANRQNAVENYISLHEELYADYYPQGSITFSDKGDFIEIKHVEGGEFSKATGRGVLGYILEDQQTMDMLASHVGSPILALYYMEDGYLHSMEIGYPDSETRRNKPFPDGKVKDRLAEITASAEEYVTKNSEHILDARCAEILSDTTAYGEYGYAEATYAIEPDGIWINVIEAPGFGFRTYMSDEDYAERVEAWTEYAERDARLFQRGFGYRFYTSEGELDLEASPPKLDYYINPHINQGENDR